MTIEQLHTASFKGVTFPCTVSQTRVGRAQIIHRFINSNKNSIEDQGLDPRGYSLTAVISGTNYLQDRDRLLATIEEGGKGTLIHPFYGRIENIVAFPVTIEEKMSALGRVEIPLVFELDESEGIPTKLINSSSEISQKKLKVLDSFSTEVKDKFKVTSTATGNFESAKNKLDGFVISLIKNVTTATISGGLANGFKAAVNDFSSNINLLINNPEELGIQMTDLMGDISNLYDEPEQILEVSGRFFDFGDDDTPIVETTTGLTERALNNSTLNKTIQGSALAVAYEAAGLIEYGTVEEIDSVSNNLESIFEKVVA